KRFAFAVRGLNIIGSKVDGTTRPRQENSGVVVSPARSGAAWIPLVLRKAVLRRFAQIDDVDLRIQYSARSAGKPAVGGAGVKASVVSASWPAITRKREGYDRLAISAVIFGIASCSHR